jgi:AhpD family alkylhydroperoxidase
MSFIASAGTILMGGHFMKKLLLYLIFALLGTLAKAQENQVAPVANKTYKEIILTLGQVPTSLAKYPQEAISGIWERMKKLQWNSKTAITGKYKELIGIAVSSQIPCPSCVYFHRKLALLYGASEKEIKEAVAMAGLVGTRAIFLNGTQTAEADFRAEVDQTLSYLQEKKKRQAMETTPLNLELNNPKEIYLDIKNSFGLVPVYWKNYPKESLPGAWRAYKEIEMSTTSEIPLKYKQLIGLAVAAQTACHFCTYHHTQTAIFQDASQEELMEAVALAGLTLEWSTLLTGHLTDDKHFRSEVDQMVEFLKNKSHAGRSL